MQRDNRERNFDNTVLLYASFKSRMSYALFYSTMESRLKSDLCQNTFDIQLQMLELEPKYWIKNAQIGFCTRF